MNCLPEARVYPGSPLSSGVTPTLVYDLGILVLLLNLPSITEYAIRETSTSPLTTLNIYSFLSL
jgi:hypothetical protein